MLPSQHLDGEYNKNERLLKNLLNFNSFESVVLFLGANIKTIETLISPLPFHSSV